LTGHVSNLPGPRNAEHKNTSISIYKKKRLLQIDATSKSGLRKSCFLSLGMRQNKALRIPGAFATALANLEHMIDEKVQLIYTTEVQKSSL
jgi:hypothetical protein